MNTITTRILAATATVIVTAASAWAQVPDRSSAPVPVRTEAQVQERIYGSDLMTEQERNSYRERMRNAGTDEERERLRAEHHEQMQKRARERGGMLPQEAPADRGPGKGRGPGSMQGGGQGKGKGR